MTLNLVLTGVFILLAKKLIDGVPESGGALPFVTGRLTCVHEDSRAWSPTGTVLRT